MTVFLSQFLPIIFHYNTYERLFDEKQSKYGFYYVV